MKASTPFWLCCLIGSLCCGRLAVAENPVKIELKATAAGPIEVKAEAPKKDEAATAPDNAKPEKVKPAEPKRNSESSSSAAPANPADSDALRLHMMDGSVITGQLAIKDLTVDTKFGPLNVPVENIRSFTPGLMSHPALGKQIAKLIEDLGSGAFNDRETAQHTLAKMGSSIRRELEHRKDDADAERRTRVRAILADFDQAQDDSEDAPAEKSDSDNSPYTQGDTVVTSEFTIVGHIVPESFAVTSIYGPLNIKMTDIRRVQRGIVKKDDAPTNFTVTSAHMTHTGSLNTGIRLERGDSVTVSASGSMIMTPWGNGAMTTPDGSTNYGWYQQNRIPVGALVGKIGTGEDYFKLGSKITFAADKAGPLQLSIAMRPEQAGNDFPGHYTVKIRVVRK